MGNLFVKTKDFLFPSRKGMPGPRRRPSTCGTASTTAPRRRWPAAYGVSPRTVSRWIAGTRGSDAIRQRDAYLDLTGPQAAALTRVTTDAASKNHASAEPLQLPHRCRHSKAQAGRCREPRAGGQYDVSRVSTGTNLEQGYAESHHGGEQSSDPQPQSPGA